MSIDIPDGLVRYFAAREERRARATAATWSAMTTCEQKLFREAAVMGYVQAHRQHAKHDDRVPPDSVIVTTVIDAIHSFNGLYPFTAGLTRRRKTKGDSR